MNPSALILLLRTKPQNIEFNQVIEVITQYYVYHPTCFSNGGLVNEPGTNEGSCKIFYFAQIHQLSAAETLHLFGDYYRKDVLAHANSNDHGNIRNFMATGWQGIIFAGQALIERD
tara:strand:- start:186 stop:533 length:348 start_codon:yes stop_codon:yes gene_type:complete